MLGQVLAALAAAAAPGAARAKPKYDPAVELLELAASPDWQGRAGRSPYCPLAAALDAAAGWQAPSGHERYCMVAALVAAEAPPRGEARWNPLGWLLDGWAADRDAWEARVASAASPLDTTRVSCGDQSALTGGSEASANGEAAFQGEGGSSAGLAPAHA
jgi:hypothetical protein